MKLLIVNYHYFREERYIGGIYPTSKKVLTLQVDAISRNGYQFTSLPSLVNIKKHPEQYQNKKLCLITFDDGLSEQLEANRILQALGIEPCFFICTLPLIERQFIDVHKIHLLRSKVDDKTLYRHLMEKSSISQCSFDKSLLNRQYRYDKPLAQKIKYFLNFKITLEERNKILDLILQQEVSELNKIFDHYYISQHHLQRLDSYSQIGAHSHTHTPFDVLDKNKAVTELCNNLNHLRNLGCQNVKAFAYPYGRTRENSNTLKRVFEKEGLNFAFTMNRTLNTSLEENYSLGRFSASDIYLGKNFAKFSNEL